jgi:hypothetical protein
MKRRTVIKHLFLVAGGTAILPACMQNKEEGASIPLKYLKINAKGEKLLAEIAETIIPASSTPGAKDTYAHLFALNMVDDCYEEEIQQHFEKGLKQVEELFDKQFGKSFINGTPQERAKIIGELEGKKGPEEAQKFYHTMKSLTIQGYLTSKPVMANILKYELIPGPYNGAAPVNTTIYPA